MARTIRENEQRCRAEGKVAGQLDEGLLLPLGERLEQQLRATAVELDGAELADQQQADTAVALDEAGQRAFVRGFDDYSRS